ncbi:dihydroorotate dehydrogenase [Dehalococcoidia bacterium]|nr:dihydroorotate dehydrogenase [Dehalococcoidia bacterium]
MDTCNLNLSVQLAPQNERGLLLSSPVMAASGTFGYGTEYAGIIDIQRLGAIVSKGITLWPREGNPQPRLVETTAGLLNSIGLENIGLEALIQDKAPLWAEWQVPVIVNIAGESIEEYAQLATLLDRVEGISGIEVNISCPNLASGGMEFGTSPRMAAEVISAVRTRTGLPVIVKLTPNVTDIVEIACAVADAGADSLTVANTFKGMVIDTMSRRPALGNISGGLSGPAIKPLALYLVYRVAHEVKVPIIGCGGIASGNDALEFIMAGASAIQVGTATFTDPQALLSIQEGIEQFMARVGARNLEELIGAAHIG